MKILIVRHGEPDYSIDSLTEKGFREAEFLSQRLSKLEIKAFYVSPLGRARATAKPTLDKMGREAEICDFLQEFTGKRTDANGNFVIPWDMMPSFWTKYPELFDCDKWSSSEAFGKNDISEKNKWVCDGVDGIIAAHGYEKSGKYYRATAPNRDTIVLFCHFGVECVILGHLLNISPVQLWHGFVAAPSSVTEICTEEREDGIAYFRVNKFGDISHLYAGGESESLMARHCECCNS